MSGACRPVRGSRRSAAAAAQQQQQQTVAAVAAAQLVQILVRRRRGDRYWSCRRIEASLPISLRFLSRRAAVELASLCGDGSQHRARASPPRTLVWPIMCVKNVWRAVTGVVHFHALYRISAC